MKNRRGSVRWRWTRYIEQPGSLRDSPVSFENKAATSASRPAFAIQVTASTTILDALLSAGLCPRFTVSHRLQFGEELVNKNGFFTAGPGRDHPDPRTRFAGDEFQIVARCFGQFVVFGDPFRGGLPS